MAVLFLVDLALGSVFIPVKQVFLWISGGEISDNHQVILYAFRLPKAITAIAAGAALAVSGLLMQTIFRNPMAGPYVLGISSGAGLGVALFVLGFSGWLASAHSTALGSLLIVAAAFAGALLVLFIILLVSLRIKNVMSILIVGMMLGSGISALVSVMQYFSNESMLKSFVIWTMGSLGGITHQQLTVFVPIIIFGLSLTLIVMKQMNVSLLGESYARSMGVNPKALRIQVFVIAGLLAGTVTAFCGPIGFLGIITPHLARMWLKTANHKWLLPASLLLGSNLLLISDILTTWPGNQQVLPINAVTSLIGIPIILWIIIRNQRLVQT